MLVTSFKVATYRRFPSGLLKSRRNFKRIQCRSVKLADKRQIAIGLSPFSST